MRAPRAEPALIRNELNAAGITDPNLRRAYRHSRGLHARHGRTYFLATSLLSPAQRPFVHALYGFARYADDVVDALDGRRSRTEQAAALDALEAGLHAALSTSQCGGNPAIKIDNPVLASVADTARRYQLDRSLFAAFLSSMRMDMRISEYATFDALARYMHGSAGVIGLQLLPVLGTVCALSEAEPAAHALGIAFQLTNFLRDVGEDLDRGRIYLPTEELAAFGVDRQLLCWCRRQQRAEPRVRRALAHLVAHTRAVYRRAAPGIDLLAPVSRPCVRTAHTLYAAILDQIEAADYHVLHRRVSVPTRHRVSLALRALPSAYAARRRVTHHGQPVN